MIELLEIDFMNVNTTPLENSDEIMIENIPVYEDPIYEEIFKYHIIKNVPCLIRNVTDKWDCSSKWRKDEKPNVEYLLSKYHDSSVNITNCNSSHELRDCKKTLSFEEYIHNYYNPSHTHDIWYLKDWHLKKEHPEDLFYSVPKYFASDWLNEYAVDNKFDDFMFVYLGPKDSWTPFHADVYSSFSWSVNVVGKKRWLLFPPGEEKQVLQNMNDSTPDVVPFLESRSMRYIEVIQNSGDALFVPSAWYHQVFNLEDTISINHNWVNGSNISIVWNALTRNMSMVEEEIAEFKNTDDWENHCQLMLKALFGLNFKEFFDFIIYISKKRLLYKSTHITFQGWRFGENHILFDLNAIKPVLEDMLKCKHYSEHVFIQITSIISEINKLTIIIYVTSVF